MLVFVMIVARTLIYQVVVKGDIDVGFARIDSLVGKFGM